MAIQAGFRNYKRFDYSTPNEWVEINAQGSFILLEVSADTDVTFYPNKQNPTQNGIPIKAGTTRQIPMMTFQFMADGDCTVVAYSA